MEGTCEGCEGKGWALFTVSEGVTLIAIQRCDRCEQYEDDLAAAEASGIPYEVRNRETGEPCEADPSNPWECVPLVEV